MEDLEKTQVGRRYQADEMQSQATMPGKRDRKPDGRFEPGDLIMGRYKVLAELGQGGMGVVYKCFDETAGIEIALKALPPPFLYLRQSNRLAFLFLRPEIPRNVSSKSSEDRDVEDELGCEHSNYSDFSAEKLCRIRNPT